MDEINEIKIKRGYTWAKTLIFENPETGARIDITGWTVYITVKENLTDTDDEETGSKNTAKIIQDITDHSNPTEGETTVSFTSVDTDLEPKTYLMDISVLTDEDEKLPLAEWVITITDRINTRI